ncbi:MAG: hypothetical protein KIS94_05150 [Chitinophagales bacterium]|nr:hypothetical protein [Chitinophagales bacterium]
MKARLFSLFVISTFSIIFFATSCKKENNDNNQIDLTTDIVGKYTSGSCLEITVSKVDNTTVSINIKDCNNNETHNATKMNTKNTFTLNKVTVVGAVETYEYSGSGVYQNNTIEITRLEKLIHTPTGVVDSEWSDTYTATR